MNGMVLSESKDSVAALANSFKRLGGLTAFGTETVHRGRHGSTIDKIECEGSKSPTRMLETSGSDGFNPER